MRCPKCGKNMNKDFCMFCGYMLNGNYIHKTNYEVNDLAKALGNDYDKVIRNENVGFIFLLGPLYFAYRNYFFLGFILEFINLFSYYILYILQYTFRLGYGEIPNVLFYFILFLYFIINKSFWMIFSNPMYKFLINKKINKIKSKYKENIDNYIINIKIRNIYKPIFAIIILGLIPIITIIIIRLYFGNL